jgi:methylphosphotriester-DNA--protein-cysteine methyltransferase
VSDNDSMNLIYAKEEIDSLKAELEKLTEEHKWLRRNYNEEKMLISDYLELKSRAEKMAEALRYTQNKIGCIIDGSSQQKWIRVVDTALAEFEKGGK